MAEFHQHPDGMVIIRTAAGHYIDTAENFAIDHLAVFGTAAPALPEGATERLYDPGDRHVATVARADVALDRGWPSGDLIIAAYDALRNAQATRQLPVTEQPGSRKLEPLAFLRRFSEAERAAIRVEAVTNPGGAVADFYDQLRTAQEIDLDSAIDTIPALDMLVAMGFIDEVRKAQILE